MSSQPTPGKLSPDLLQALHGIKSVRLFPKGATLFQQGVVATGVYLVESGEVRVLLPTGQSQKQLLEVVGPGTMLGLSESMSGERYRITAEAGEQRRRPSIRASSSWGFCANTVISAWRWCGS